MPPGHIGADHEKGAEFDDRFHRDHEHQAMLVFRRIDAAVGEGQGKNRDQRGHDDRHEQRWTEQAGSGARVAIDEECQGLGGDPDLESHEDRAADHREHGRRSPRPVHPCRSGRR